MALRKHEGRACISRRSRDIKIHPQDLKLLLMGRREDQTQKGSFQPHRAFNAGGRGFTFLGNRHQVVMAEGCHGDRCQKVAKSKNLPEKPASSKQHLFVYQSASFAQMDVSP